MEVMSYLNKIKDIYQSILDYVEDDENAKDNLEDFKNELIVQNINEKTQILKDVLFLIAKIANNHCKSTAFYIKIEQLIKLLKTDILKNFTNIEIFNIFKENKYLILFLLEEKVITINICVAQKLCEEKYRKAGYLNYFFPEIKSFLNDRLRHEIERENNKYLRFQESENKYGEIFEKRRKIGENDSYLYEIIRNDIIDEFVPYYSRNNFSLSQTVEDSMFETNCFLLKNKPTLIEYSAFYGSIQIFRFLLLNGIKMKERIWLFAIHGHNPEIIHILEENQIISSNFYQKCLDEAIKCHHNRFVYYLSQYFYDINSTNEYNLFRKSIKYYNYLFFPNDIVNNMAFHDICFYGNDFLAELLLKSNEIDINTKIIIINI